MNDANDSASSHATTVHLGDDSFEKQDEAAAAMLVGTHLGQYRLDSLLGMGGMGHVYLAWHEMLHRWCALKLIRPEWIKRDPSQFEQFLNEARLAARLNHPHIVTIHSIGREDGHDYLEMEFVSGGSLRKCLEGEPSLDPVQAATWVADMAAGMVAAHEAGVIHGDIKPDNTMVTQAGLAKLADFGLARFSGSKQKSSGISGTPHYMAPEFFTGAHPSPATDVYALGVTFFNLLTGDVPYPVKSMSDLIAVHRDRKQPMNTSLLEAVPRDAAAIIREMLSYAPEDRPASGRVLAERLRNLANAIIPTQDLVRCAMEGEEIAWYPEGAERFVFDVPLPGNRHQRVCSEIIDDAIEHDRLMTFWTACAPEHAEHHRAVLELNSRLPFGAISVREYEGRPYFIMVHNHARRSIDPVSIRESVRNMAHWADLLEHELTGNDIH